MPQAELIITPNIPDQDGFYEELLNAHEGLEKAQSDALNARLIFLLANQIGDRTILSEAINAAIASAPERKNENE